MIVSRTGSLYPQPPYPATMAPAKIKRVALREPKRVLLAGDVHMRTKQVEYLIRMAKAEGCEAIFQLGDLGFWAHMQDGMQFLFKVGKMLDHENIDLYWIDGNHDNHSLLWSYKHPLRDGWPMIAPRIYYCPRGTRWTWRGVKFIGVGGGFSIDKEYRKPEKSWWFQETITDEQVIAASTDLVDVMLCHDVPWLVKLPFTDYKNDLETEMNRRQLLKIAEAVKPKLIVHGHYHQRLFNYLESWTVGRAIPVVGLDRDGSHELSWVVFDLATCEIERT